MTPTTPDRVSAMSNERCHERFPVRNVVQVGSRSETPHEIDYLHNVSNGGLSFRSEHFWPRGNAVHIVVQTDQTFEIPAVVRWCRTHTGQFEVGVEFSTPPDKTMVNSLREMDITLAIFQVTALSP